MAELRSGSVHPSGASPSQRRIHAWGFNTVAAGPPSAVLPPVRGPSLGRRKHRLTHLSPRGMAVSPATSLVAGNWHENRSSGLSATARTPDAVPTPSAPRQVHTVAVLPASRPHTQYDDQDDDDQAQDEQGAPRHSVFPIAAVASPHPPDPRVHELHGNPFFSPSHAPHLASLSFYPPLERLRVSAGELFPAFSPFIFSYDLLVPAGCPKLQLFPRCFPHSNLEALVNARSSFIPMTLSHEAHQRVLVSFKLAHSMAGYSASAAVSESLAQVTYIVHVRVRCSPVHKLKDCSYCRQDYMNTLAPPTTLPPLRPILQLHFFPFIKIYKCTKAHQARCSAELSCGLDDVVAVKLMSACGGWWLGHIVRVGEADGLGTRLLAAGWIPARNLTSHPGLPDEPQHSVVPSALGTRPLVCRTQTVFLATTTKAVPAGTRGADGGTHVVVTLAGPQLSHFWAVPVTVETSGAVRAAGLPQWLHCSEVTFSAMQAVQCRTCVSSESSNAVAEGWAPDRDDPRFFPASKVLFENSCMLPVDSAAFSFVDGRLIDWAAPLKVFDADAASVISHSRGNLNETGASGRPPSYSGPLSPPAASRPSPAKPSRGSITSVSESARQEIRFTVLVIVAQLLMLIVALVDGGIHSTDNPLLGPAAPTLRRLGARWLPAIRAGNIHLLFTPLFLPVGIVRFVIDAVLHLLLCWPVEARLGPWRTAAVYLIAGAIGNITGCIFVSRWLISGCGGALFGMAAAAGWLTLRRPALAVAPDPETGITPSRPGVLSRRRLVAVGLLLACVLVLGALPGCDNWTHVGGLSPGFLCAMALDNQPVIQRRRREHHVLRATAGGLLAMLCFASIIIMAYVTDVNNPCSWCMRATCFDTMSWCSTDLRLGAF